VKVNGADVKKYPLKRLRRLLGYVPQRASLVSGTVRENLLWGDPAAGDETLRRALKIAAADEFVAALPDGLDSPVKEGGKNFSGGQKQRLTVARALVREPQILILDDSSSALDYATDAILRRNLKTLSPELTVIIISQRATSLKNADRILALDEGKAAGLGTHAELIESCAVYREICNSQIDSANERDGQNAVEKAVK
jgi:ATP-binding cassette subfamily B protein